MRIHRRSPQLINPAWVNPADPPITFSEGADIDTQTPQIQEVEVTASDGEEEVMGDVNLSNRDADTNAIPTPNAEAEAGEVVSHRLDQTYPDIPRPTPIKLQNGGEGSTPPVLVQSGDNEGFGSDSNSMDSDGDDDGEQKEDGGNNDEQKLKGVEDIAKSISLPGLPLGMPGPLISPTTSISSLPDNGPEGIMEIEILPSADGMSIPSMLAPTAMQDNNVVEEIWITTDDSSSPTSMGPAGAGMSNPLDMLANQLESIMGGMFGGPKPEEKKLGQPIDQVMLPNGLPQKGPEATMDIGGDDTTTNAGAVGGDEAAERGWEDMGKVAGILLLSVIGPIVIITALGCGITFLVKRVKAKGRGYREVQPGPCGDEEWN
ncbi:hypothetical protein TWF718_006386 [Orbilia javanica]|uniref:Uncharacterized protein n=1 Tax=Orbilia javanica TaxID=47235 RepID=A0AAN8N4X5_9PEZI